ncbi:glycosyltransferase [Breznakia sp. OttesenSCG-928-G09]|nr:glycosyltransferase [Breznakia sp. OttesenSCG-928-G09]
MNKKKIPLSIICVYNKQEQLDEYLLKSYNQQDVECQLVLIDNRNKEFSCAVDAINYGIEQSTSDLILVSHQDIMFLKEDSLRQIYNECIGLGDVIVGVAGVEYNAASMKQKYSSILHGMGKHTSPVAALATDIQEVFTVDECLFGFTKNVLDKINFDNQVCDSWHLYAVDLCYQAQLAKIPVYVVRANLQHVSTGDMNHDFYVGLKKLQDKYRDKFDYISSCCINIKIEKDPLSVERRKKILKPYYYLREKYIRYSWTLKDRLRRLRGK